MSRFNNCPITKVFIGRGAGKNKNKYYFHSHGLSWYDSEQMWIVSGEVYGNVIEYSIETTWYDYELKEGEGAWFNFNREKV